jgi:hypothetical protein
MAGGMHRGRARPSLGERAADSGVGGPRAEPPPVGSPSAGSPPAPERPERRRTGRHCWVRDPPEWPGTWPGLLVEWRQRPDGWHGRVAYTVTGPHGPVLVETWLPADRLEQR